MASIEELQALHDSDLAKLESIEQGMRLAAIAVAEAMRNQRELIDSRVTVASRLEATRQLLAIEVAGASLDQQFPGFPVLVDVSR